MGALLNSFHFPLFEIAVLFTVMRGRGLVSLLDALLIIFHFSLFEIAVLFTIVRGMGLVSLLDIFRI